MFLILHALFFLVYRSVNPVLSDILFFLCSNHSEYNIQFVMIYDMLYS